MKKSFLLLTALLAALVLFVSCGEDPFFKDVTFLDSDGTTVLSTEVVLVGDKASAPDYYSFDNYGMTVEKWLTEDGEVFDLETDTISDNIKLKAVWRELKVGDRGPAGGTIFYVADTVQTSIYYDKNGKKVEYTWKYLEAAPSESDETYYFGYYYKDGKLASCGATPYAIGQGRMTTSLLVNAMGDTAPIKTSSSETAVYAAKYADDYTCGGYDDWFLPSTHELRQIYRSKTVTYKYKYYMSSTEYSAVKPEANICLGSSTSDKELYLSRETADVHVWPIRAF